jgi:hypothetical protein
MLLTQLVQKKLAPDMTPAELRAALTALGWSWADLAEPLGIDRSVPQRWTQVPPMVVLWVEQSLHWHAQRPKISPNWREATSVQE